MGTAFGLLRLSPDAFWKMTLIELCAALEVLGVTRSGAPQRGDLERLMRLFPDGHMETTHGR